MNALSSRSLIESILDAMQAPAAVIDSAGIIVIANRGWRNSARVAAPFGDDYRVGDDYVAKCRDDENVPAGNAMLRDYFGMYRFDWPDDDGIEFHLGHGDWVRVLRNSGFEILDLIEMRPSGDAETEYPFVTTEWARRWPAEEIWRARKL